MRSALRWLSMEGLGVAVGFMSIMIDSRLQPDI